MITLIILLLILVFLWLMIGNKISPIFAIIRNYGTDKRLTLSLEQSLESGICTIINNDEFYIKIIFNNGLNYRMWKVNQFYAWLSEGTVSINNEVVYTWSKSMPSRIVSQRLFTAINKIPIYQNK